MQSCAVTVAKRLLPHLVNMQSHSREETVMPHRRGVAASMFKLVTAGIKPRPPLLVPKWDYSGILSDLNSEHFGSLSKNILKSDLKKSWICQNFWPIPTHFRSKSDTPVNIRWTSNLDPVTEHVALLGLEILEGQLDDEIEVNTDDVYTSGVCVVVVGVVWRFDDAIRTKQLSAARTLCRTQNGLQDSQIRAQSGPDWPRMGHIRFFFRSNFSTEIYPEEVPDMFQSDPL